jgi:MoCo/4Fe-4S cofactor protein with predicted Tat translocation signal
MSSLIPENLSGKEYWRSLDELADRPEFRQFVQREFPSRAWEWLNGNRRNFLKIMGASFALAGLAGCRRWPAETLAPYAHMPANRDPGTPVHYATAMDFGGIGQGLLVTSVDGRPIKVDGNPTHPLNRGGSDIYVQASILGVYDPDRSRSVILNNNGKFNPAGWPDFEAFWQQRYAGISAANGKGLAILSGASSSPSVADMQARLIKGLPEAQWFEYEPISYDNIREGTRLAFGAPQRVVPNLAAAEVIVSLDLDLFVGDPLSVKYARDFADGRRLTDANGKPQKDAMNRLYVIESTFSMTGSHAENNRHRMAVAAKDVPAVAALLAAEIQKRSAGIDFDIPVVKTPPPGFDPEIISAIADDLVAAKGRSIIVAGASQPSELHAMVALLNGVLGNTGRTVSYYLDPQPDRPTHLAAITNLAAAMKNKQVTTLVILGGNPVYDAPADLDFAGALSNVPLSIHLADNLNETSQLCTWQLPRSHYLENWGDVSSFDGTISIVQPLIEPIFGGRSEIELLALLIQDSVRDGYSIVQRAQGISAIEWKWKKALFDGFIEGTAWSTNHIRPNGAALSAVLQPALDTAAAIQLSPQALEVVFRPDNKVYDGRFANNGWLQELPDPMTRVTWDNPALVNPKTAAALGLNPFDYPIINIQLGGRSVEVAVYVLPGQPENSISLALGYGRSSAGNVGNGAGFNVYALRSSAGMNAQTGAVATATGKKYQLATTQDHHVIEAVSQKAIAARIPDLIKQATFADFQKDPSLGFKKPYSVNLWTEQTFSSEYQWAMAVDLTTCIGCSACVVACQAENNIPIVGKEQVINGREMHWLRIDRYFRGPDTANPQVVHEPVLCMQCENAPCEAVCPVGATSHSQEGLSMMTYNRCIGTRYCANNCPYKVRRFNFFDYNSGSLKDLYKPNILRSEMDPLVAMQKNPQVTIRMRGVMEKCSYCVQRIDTAKAAAERENRQIRDGEVAPACTVACPTQALVFGNKADPKSRVAVLQNQQRCYGILDDMLATKPRTQYLPKVWNPNPALAEAPLGVLGTE